MTSAIHMLLAFTLLWGVDGDALRSAWSEALELDDAARVVTEAPRAFAEDEELARDGELVALHARALASTGGAAEARALLEAAEVGATTRPAIELELARLDLVEDRLDAVIARLATKDAEAPVRHAERADAWWLLGKALARRGDAKRADPLLQYFVSAWRLHPQAPSAWHLLAQSALSRRELEQAKFCRDRGRELSTWHGYYRTRRLQVLEDPDAPLPRLGLAQLWLSVDELARAREVIVDLTERAPDFARGWSTLGEVERKLDEPSKALVAYGKALVLDPELHDARFNRALLALARGDEVQARADFVALTNGDTADDPRYAGAHLQLARFLKQDGEVERASLHYAKYRALGGTEAL